MLVFIRKGEDFPHGYLKLPEGRLKPPARIPRMLNAELLVVLVEPWVITPRLQDTTCNNKGNFKTSIKTHPFVHITLIISIDFLSFLEFFQTPNCLNHCKHLPPLRPKPSPCKLVAAPAAIAAQHGLHRKQQPWRGSARRGDLEDRFDRVGMGWV